MAKDSIFRIFAGPLGSYKSYNGVLELIETFRNGGIGYTNIPLNWERIKMFCEDQYDIVLDDRQYVPIDYTNVSKFVDQLQRGTRDRSNRAVIDEAAIHFDSSDRNVDKLTEHFVVHMRKLHIDTIFVCHDFYEVQKRLRNKAQSVTWFRDLQKIKWLGFQLPFPYYCFTEVDAKNPKLRYDRAMKRKDKRIYKLYTSHDVQSVEMDCIEDAPEMDIQKIERPPKYRGLKTAFKFGVMFSLGATMQHMGGCKSKSSEPVDLGSVEESVAELGSAEVQEPEIVPDPEPVFQVTVTTAMILNRRPHVYLSDGRRFSGSSVQSLDSSGAVIGGVHFPMSVLPVSGSVEESTVSDSGITFTRIDGEG